MVAGKFGIAGALLGAVGLTPAVLGATGFAILSGVTSAALSFGVSQGINAIANELLGTKPRASSLQSGVQLDQLIGGDIPNQIGIGPVATRGQRVYQNFYGESNRYVQRVWLLSDGVCDALQEVWDGRAKHSLIPQPVGGTEDALFHIEGYDDLIKVRFFSGRDGQLADAELVTHANPPERWDANAVGTGRCYVSVTFEYNAEKFAQGIPRFLWVLRGAKLYDWRFDSTNGGDGPQRWHDRNTWVYSANPAVAHYNYLRGFYIGGERLLGQDYDVADLDHAKYTLAADICDETVIEDGQARPRYSCSVFIKDGEEHAVALSAFTRAMAGYNYNNEGIASVVAGASRAPVASINDADCVAGATVNYSAKRSAATLANAVQGQFTDPENGWTPSSYPSLRNAAWEAEDASQRVVLPLDLMPVSNRYQARAIRDIRAKEIRHQKQVTRTLPYKFMALEPGDVVTYTDRHGTFDGRIDEMVFNQNRTINVSLQEVSDSIHTDDPSVITSNPGIPPADPATATIEAPLAVVPSIVNGGTHIKVVITPPDPLPIGFAGYRLRYGPLGAAWEAQTPLIGGLVTTEEIEVPVLAPGSYRISAKAETEGGLQSSTFAYGTLAITSPALATGLAVTAFLNHQLVEFSVPAGSKANKAHIYVRADAGAPGAGDIAKSVLVSGGRQFTANVGGLPANVDHWFYVQLEDPVGNVSALTVPEISRTKGSADLELSASTRAGFKAQSERASELINSALTQALDHQELVETVAARFGENSAAIVTVEEVQATEQAAAALLSTTVIALADDASSTWRLVLDTNGLIGGIQQGNDGEVVDLVIVADKVQVGPTDGSSKQSLVNIDGTLNVNLLNAEEIAVNLLNATTVTLQEIVLAGGGAVLDTSLAVEIVPVAEIATPAGDLWVDIYDASFPNTKWVAFWTVKVDTRKKPGTHQHSLNYTHFRVLVNGEEKYKDESRNGWALAEAYATYEIYGTVTKSPTSTANHRLQVQVRSREWAGGGSNTNPHPTEYSNREIALIQLK